MERERKIYERGKSGKKTILDNLKAWNRLMCLSWSFLSFFHRLTHGHERKGDVCHAAGQSFMRAYACSFFLFGNA